MAVKRRAVAAWAARTSAAQRLATGLHTLYRRRSDALASWVAAGRRDDLPGWRGALGPVVRLALLGIGVYVVYAIIRALPWLMWLLIALVARAAWRASRTPAEAPDETPEQAPAEAVRTLLLECLGDRPAVHLSTVLARLHQEGHNPTWTVSDLRAALEAMGIPVRPKVKVGGVPTRGVHRDDLQAPSPAPAPEASPAPSTAA